MSEIQNSSVFALDDISDEEMNNLIDGTVTDFDEGSVLVTRTVVKIERDEVLLDIGYKSEGVIPAHESIRKDVNPADVVSLGDQIEALVLQKEDKEGRLVLSKKRAEYERAWNRVGGVVQLRRDRRVARSSRSSRAALSSISAFAASCLRPSLTFAA